MRILHLSQADSFGGAAIATYRLHAALRSEQIDSHMLVQEIGSGDDKVHTFTSKRERAIAKLRPSIDKIPLIPYRQRQKTPFSCDWFPSQIPREISKHQPDILNLHWIGGGYLRIESLAGLRYPQAWTLHDMWAFTGGCHYNGECEGYQSSCGQCLQLGSSHQWDLSRWIWHRKAKTYLQLPLTVVCPSQWLAQCAKNSSLLNSFDIRVIPNAIDCQKYRPIERYLARQLLNLPTDKRFILFGAMSATSDPRKGFHLLQPALQQLREEALVNQIELLIFGASKPTVPPDLGLPTRYLGRLYDDLSLALAYNASDVFVAPSMQDNLPNTVLEAIACGIPCVAFNIGGLPDMIDHKVNGYLAAPFSPAELADGIAWVLQDNNRYQTLSKNARIKAEKNFTLAKQALAYRTLYEGILERGV